MGGGHNYIVLFVPYTSHFVSDFKHQFDIYRYWIAIYKMKNKQNDHTVGEILKSNGRKRQNTKHEHKNTLLLIFLAWYRHFNNM